MLEGGGQILRTSIALAALLQKEVLITRIRGKRTPPGLKAQHVTGVSAVAAISKAHVEGLHTGSNQLYFCPKEREGGEYHLDVGTAGSVTLVLQAVMPASAFAYKPSQITITGGTDVRWSPSIDYLKLVILPNLSLLGYNGSVRLERRGHYPKGGGRIIFTINPIKHLSPLVLEGKKSIKKIYGISHSVMLPRHVAQRQANAAEKVLKNYFDQAIIDVQTCEGLCPGSGITVTATFDSGAVIGADSIGERGKPAEKVGEEAALKLLEEIDSQATFDRHMGDIIIPYLAVAKGRSQITVSRFTLHTLTNIRVTESIVGVQFSFEDVMDKPARIVVDGLGLTS